MLFLGDNRANIIIGVVVGVGSLIIIIIVVTIVAVICIKRSEYHTCCIAKNIKSLNLF